MLQNQIALAHIFVSIVFIWQPKYFWINESRQPRLNDAVKHVGIIQQPIRHGMRGGWNGMSLNALKSILERTMQSKLVIQSRH